MDFLPRPGESTQTPAPLPGEVPTLREALRELGLNLGRLSSALDLLPDDDWLAPFDASALMLIAERWTPGPTCMIEVLGYARDEEAYRFGRRLMRLLQEHRPTFEHLTYELASAYTPYRSIKPAIHFSELTKSRLTWLTMTKAAGPFGEVRLAELPPEEGGGEVRLEQIVHDALRRDAMLIPLIAELRLSIGHPRRLPTG